MQTGCRRSQPRAAEGIHCVPATNWSLRRHGPALPAVTQHAPLTSFSSPALRTRPDPYL
ncbi:hypothetical protein B0T18DRAFT_404576 [Schizothecium vesticola]|uniref:Uncharacterized protein n=1 Tax=Schizothecium vesticola TaxID=314040 RepID=A0AA40KAS6_9PEZI|nr:hypothetical protein B0T18DRAFT_404576 [Schizothecium vesticola]